MNSAALPTAESPPEELLNHVRRTYRRICLLRATGHPSEALDLELDEFSRLLAAAHDAGVAEHRTSAAKAEEAARVAEASTLAEVLAPLLAEKLREPSAPSAAPAPAPAARPAARPAADAPFSPSPAPASAGAPSIADLLDGMLALESPRSAR